MNEPDFWDRMLVSITIIERSLLFVFLFMMIVERFPDDGKFRRFLRNLKSHFKKNK